MRRVIATVAVKCGGGLHRIGLCQDGDFIYYHHSHENARRFLLMTEIGGDVPMCLRFLKVGEILSTPDIPEVRRNHRFTSAIKRLQIRRFMLSTIRRKRKEEHGLGKRLRRGDSILGLIIGGPAEKPDPKPVPPKPPRFPPWVPTYLKPYAIYQIHRAHTANDRSGLTRIRFMQLRSHAWRRPKCKVYWSSKSSGRWSGRWR